MEGRFGSERGAPVAAVGVGGSGGFWVCLYTGTLLLAGGRVCLPAVLLLLLRSALCHTLSERSKSLCRSEGWFVCETLIQNLVADLIPFVF